MVSEQWGSGECLLLKLMMYLVSFFFEQATSKSYFILRLYISIHGGIMLKRDNGTYTVFSILVIWELFLEYDRREMQSLP